MSDLDPDEYESVTGVAKAEYEQRLLAGARDYLLAIYPDGSADATIESVEIGGDSLATALVVLFRIPARPECRFGCRRELWPASPLEAAETPEVAGEWCVVSSVEEFVEQGGLVVRECVRDGITWL